MESLDNVALRRESCVGTYLKNQLGLNASSAPVWAVVRSSSMSWQGGLVEWDLGVRCERGRDCVFAYGGGDGGRGAEEGELNRGWGHCCRRMVSLGFSSVAMLIG